MHSSTPFLRTICFATLTVTLTGRPRNLVSTSETKRLGCEHAAFRKSATSLPGNLVTDPETNRLGGEHAAIRNLQPPYLRLQDWLLFIVFYSRQRLKVPNGGAGYCDSSDSL